MHVHRVASHALLWCGVAALAGCAKSDSNKVDSATAAAPVAANSTTATTPAAATTTSAGAVATPIVLSELTGKWKAHSVPQSGTDTSATDYTMTTTGTTNGWKITFANGQVVPLKVTQSGDSVVTDAGPYKSVRRKGLTVSTHGVFHKEGDKLVGTTTAHYVTKGADSVLVLRTEATKQP